MQAACDEADAPPGGMGPWAVTLPGLLGKESQLRVSSLVVGLRKTLRERIADAGRRVKAYVLSASDNAMKAHSDDSEMLESFYLDSFNNFRCEYPHLEEKPLVLSDGIRVRFCVVDDDTLVYLMTFSCVCLRARVCALGYVGLNTYTTSMVCLREHAPTHAHTLARERARAHTHTCTRTNTHRAHTLTPCAACLNKTRFRFVKSTSPCKACFHASLCAQRQETLMLTCRSLTIVRVNVCINVCVSVHACMHVCVCVCVCACVRASVRPCSCVIGCVPVVESSACCASHPPHGAVPGRRRRPRDSASQRGRVNWCILGC